MYCETQQQGSHDNQSMICNDFHARSRGTTQFFVACVVIALDWLEAESQRSNGHSRKNNLWARAYCYVTLFNIAN